MPTIDGCKLPDQIAAEMKELIKYASPDILVAYARNHPEAARGFQLKKTSAVHIRKYLLNRFPDDGELGDDLKAFLTGEGFNNSFVAVLSETVLKRYFKEFLNIYGRALFISGLLLDSREAIRGLAIDYLNKYGEAWPEDVERQSPPARRTAGQPCTGAPAGTACPRRSPQSAAGAGGLRGPARAGD